MPKSQAHFHQPIPNQEQGDMKNELEAKNKKNIINKIPKHFIEVEGKKVNPFKVLGVDLNSDANDLKKHFNELSLIYHPDKRTGDVAKFQIITKCYKHLLPILNKDGTIDTNRFDSEVKGQHYSHKIQDIHKSHDSRFENKSRNFKNEKTIEKFNTLFGEYNQDLYNPNNDGYASMMSKSDHNTSHTYNPTEYDNSVVDQSLINSDRQVIIYKEPESYFQSTLGGATLGDDKIEDFTVDGVGGDLQGCDFRRAHLIDNQLMTPNDINFQENQQTVEQYQQVRSGQNFELTKEEADYYRNKKEEEDRIERERRLRMQQHDEMAEKLYGKYNKKMITDVIGDK